MYQKHKISLLYSTILLFVNIYIYSQINLMYDITNSPDFNIYIEYIYHFFGLNEQTNIDNGSIYYYLISIVLTFYEGSYQGNNYLIILNNAVQSLNFVISLIGLLGYYLFFIKKGYKKDSIFIALILLSIFVPFLQIKMTMKPEILAFALIPYLLVNLENYFRNNTFTNLLNSIFLYAILISLRVSIFVIVSVFLLFYFYQNIKNLTFKKLTILFILTILTFTPLLYQDYQINGYSLFSNSEVRQEFASGDYDNKASIKTIFNVNFLDLGMRPYLDNHSDSFIGITLLDTFNDYFHLYWNRDKSLFNRNQYIKNLDFNNFYINKFFDNFEYYLGLFISLIFYFFLFKSYKDNKNLKLLITPIIGMVLVVINSLGIPYNNFNPLKGDTYKTFYYSFLLTLAFVQLVIHLQDKVLLNKKTRKNLFMIIYITSIILILGFPKYYTNDMSENMSNQYASSPLCRLNIKLNNNFKNIDCLQKDDNFCSWSNNYRKPELDQNGNKVYFKDDKFGSLILTKDQSVEFVESFAECEDLKSDGYEFFISRDRIKNLPLTNAYLIILGLINSIQLTLFFKSSKAS